MTETKHSLEMQTMNALSVVMNHCGSKNVQRLLKYKAATKECELIEQLEVYKQNSSNWGKLSPKTLIILCKMLIELEGMDPINDTAFPTHHDFLNFTNDIMLANRWMLLKFLQEEIKMVALCLTTLGFNVRYWKESKCLSVYSKHIYMESEAEDYAKFGRRRRFTDYLANADPTPIIYDNLDNNLEEED
jgi:hypothetical protein